MTQHKSISLLLKELSDQTISLVRLVLLREMIGFLDDPEFELIEELLSQCTAVMRHVLVRLAEQHQSGNEGRRAGNRIVEENVTNQRSIVIHRSGESSILREDVLVDFEVGLCFVFHNVEDSQVADAVGELRQKRHLEVEHVPRHPELLHPAADQLRPNFSRRSPDHHVLLQCVHVPLDISKADDCAPVVSNQGKLLATC